jgi:hypothetical protein
LILTISRNKITRKYGRRDKEILHHDFEMKLEIYRCLYVQKKSFCTNLTGTGEKEKEKEKKKEQGNVHPSSLVPMVHHRTLRRVKNIGRPYGVLKCLGK